MNNKLIKTCILSLFFFLISCSSIKLFIQANQTQYIASISPDFQNGRKIILSLYTVGNFSETQRINLNEQFFGKFVTISPQIRMPGMNEGTFPVEGPAYGGITINKKNKLHLLFIFGDIKEEFLINIENNSVEIEEIESSGIIEFSTDEVNLIPENTLSIGFRKEQYIPKKIQELLKSNGAKSIKLAEGDYRKFRVDSYSEEDDCAHLEIHHRRDKINKVNYFFEVTENFTMIDSLIKSLHPDFNKIGAYINYNFNINQMIEAEKNGGLVYTQITLPGFSSGTKAFREVLFSCNENDSVRIQITNRENKIVKRKEFVANITAKITYVWDGQMDDGNQAPSGLYFYNIKVGKNKSIRRKFIW